MGSKSVVRERQHWFSSSRVPEPDARTDFARDSVRNSLRGRSKAIDRIYMIDRIREKIRFILNLVNPVNPVY